MSRDHAGELLAVLAVAHWNLDHRGIERINAPSWATAQLMKEPPVSAVSDLFDPIPNEPTVQHGTVAGAKDCRKMRGMPPGELCFSCANAVRTANRPHSASSSARGTTRAAETAKALEAHRRECAPLRAEVRAMIAAEKRSA